MRACGVVKNRKPSAIGVRLNDVRRAVGAKDLTTFYESLDGSSLRGFPSYAAAATYHAKPWRDPPTVYLARIVERHPDINPVWLLTGTGNPSLSAERAEAALAKQPGQSDDVNALFDAAFPGAGAFVGGQFRYNVPGPAARAMLWRLWSAMLDVRYQDAQLARSRGGDDSDDKTLQIEAAQLVVRAVLAPLEAMDAMPPTRQESDRFTSASWKAFDAAMHGDRLDSYIIRTCDTLVAVVRRQDWNASERLILEYPQEGDTDGED